ncbi:hypothetical protein [uncultured Fibrobacter sp.]|nr:hypothetical protein [uncultured Fibrobacter sp.]
MKKTIAAIAAIASLLFVVGCASNPPQDNNDQTRENAEKAYNELDNE